MKSIYKFASLFFASTITYGLVTHNFLDYKSGSRVLYDPLPKLIEKDKLAERHLEKIFKDKGTDLEKKEDIELGISFLKSKLKKQEEVILAKKKLDNNSTYETVLLKLDSLFKNTEEIKKDNSLEMSKQKIIVKKEEKLAFKNELQKPLNSKKIEIANSANAKVYEFSKTEKKLNQVVSKDQPKNQNKNIIISSTTERKNKNLNESYEVNIRTETISYEKNKFKEKVQQIEIVRLERNKKLSEDF